MPKELAPSFASLHNQPLYFFSPNVLIVAQCLKAYVLAQWVENPNYDDLVCGANVLFVFLKINSAGQSDATKSALTRPDADSLDQHFSDEILITNRKPDPGGSREFGDARSKAPTMGDPEKPELADSSTSQWPRCPTLPVRAMVDVLSFLACNEVISPLLRLQLIVPPASSTFRSLVRSKAWDSR